MTPWIVAQAVRSRLFWALILVLIGGYFRIVAIDTTVVENPLRADALDYFASAFNLVRHGVYSRSIATINDPEAKPPQPDAYRSPGVPLMMAPFVSLWPDRERIVHNLQLINVALGLAAIAAIFLAASRLLPLPAAIAVGLLTATSPHLVSLSVYVLSETPGSFLVAMLLAVASIGVPARPAARISFFVALGAIVGALALFRPVFLAFAPVLALAWPDRADKWRALLCCCLGAGLVMAPWMIRNALLPPMPGTPSLLATVTLEGSYPGFLFNGDPRTFPYGAHYDPRFGELVTSFGGVLQEVLRKVAASPVDSLAWYLVQKPVFLFQWTNIDGVGDVLVYPVTATPFRTNALFLALHDPHQFAHVLVLLAAVAGGVAAWVPAATRWVPSAKPHVVRIASLLFAFVYLIHVPFVVNTRYSVPIFPALYLLAVFALVAALRSVWITRAPSRPSASGAGASARSRGRAPSGK